MVTVRGWFGYGRRKNLQAMAQAAREHLDGIEIGDGHIVLDATTGHLSVALTAVRELGHEARAGLVRIDDGQVQLSVGPPWLPTAWEVSSLPEGVDRLGEVAGACPEQIEVLAFHPDGSALAVGCCSGFAATALVLGLHPGAPGQALVARSEESMGWARAERWLSFLGGNLVTAGRDAVVRCWEPQSGRLLRQRVFPDRIDASAASPDGSRVAVWIRSQREIQLLDGSLKPCGTVGAHRVKALSYGDGGHLLVQGRGELQIVDPSGQTSWHHGTFTAPALLPDGRVVVIRGEEEASELVILGSDGEVTLPLERPRGLGVSPGGQHLVALGHDTICVFELQEQRRVARLEIPGEAHLSDVVAIRGDGAQVALAAGDRLVLWEVGGAAPALVPALGAVLACDASGSRLLLERRLRDGTIAQRWRAIGGSGEEGPTEAVRDPALSADGRVRLGLLDPDDDDEDHRSWLVYDALDGGERLGRIRIGNVYGPTLSADARTLAVIGDGLELHEAGSGALVTAVGDRSPTASALAVRADAAVVLADDVLTLFSPSDGTIVRRWTVGEAWAVAIAEDGSWVLAVGAATTRYDADADAPRWSVPTQPGGRAAIAPDGAHAVVAWGGALAWIRAEDGEILERRVAHPHRITALAFRSDGGLVSIGGEGTLVRWPPRGAGRPPLPDSVEQIRGILSHGAATMAEAAEAASAAEGAPWVRSDQPPWPRAGHAPLPPITGPCARIDPGQAPVARGALTFWGEAPLIEASRAYAEATGAGGLQRSGGTLRLEPVPPEVAADQLIVGLGALAQRAIGGSITLSLPDRLEDLVFWPTERSPTAQIGVPPGAWMRLEPSHRERIDASGVQHHGERFLWLLEPYAPEPGEPPPEHRPVVRLRTVDLRSGATIASQALPFEPELRISPDGTLSTLQLETVQRHMGRMVGQRDTIGIYVIDNEINERGVLKPEGRIDWIEAIAWSPDSQLVAFTVRLEGGERLEVWDPTSGARVQAVEEPHGWTFLDDGRLLVALQGELRWLDPRSGEVLAQISWPEGVYELVPSRGRVAVGGEETLALIDPGGEILHRWPGIRARGGALSEDGTTWCSSRGRIRLADGAPLGEPDRIDAVALSGEGLATWGDGVLIVRRWITGDVLFRGPLQVDHGWQDRSQLSLSLVGDQLVVCASASIQVLDVRSGAWRHSAPCDLAAIVSVGGGQILAGQRSGVLRWWDVASGVELRRQELSLSSPLQGLSVDAQQRWALLCLGEQATLIELETGQHLCTVPMDATSGRGELSPDGQRFLITGDGTRLYDRSGALLWSQEGSRWAAFADSGRLLLCGHGTQLQVIDAARCAQVGTLRGHLGPVRCLAEGDQALITVGAEAIVWSREGLSALGWTHADPVPLPQPPPRPEASADYEAIME